MSGSWMALLLVSYVSAWCTSHYPLSHIYQPLSENFILEPLLAYGASHLLLRGAQRLSAQLWVFTASISSASLR